MNDIPRSNLMILMLCILASIILWVITMYVAINALMMRDVLWGGYAVTMFPHEDFSIISYTFKPLGRVICSMFPLIAWTVLFYGFLWPYLTKGKKAALLSLREYGKEALYGATHPLHAFISKKNTKSKK